MAINDLGKVRGVAPKLAGDIHRQETFFEKGDTKRDCRRSGSTLGLHGLAIYFTFEVNVKADA